MSVYRGDVVNIELSTGTMFRSFLNKSIGEGDDEGNRFGFRVFRNGEPVDISQCTVMGYFINNNGQTVIMQGSSVGNLGYVILPEECYAVEGNFSLAIKASGGGITGTLRIVDGAVVNTSTDSIIDPGNVIPSLADWIALIAQAEAAVEDIAKFIVTEEIISGDDYRMIVDVEE